MNRHLGVFAYVLGLLALAWVGLGYLGSNPLALTMTLLIGAFYLMGGLELLRFHRATAGLAAALASLAEPPPQLGDWLGRLPPSLQNPVRLRIENGRGALPGPAMTPYLVGLLVILGMLGTFLGMVVTLQGAVMALESTTDLATIRAALSAPVKGLGLAFGTSIAGVAASAMLGLAAALCRRERLQASQRLDTRIAGALRPFSLAYQRQQTLQLVQAQAAAMPAVVDQLQALVLQMERQTQALHTQLVAGQERFHQDTRAVHAELASALDRSLRHSLSESARLAGATIQPVVETTMAGIARETSALQQHLADTVRQQLEGLSCRFDGTVSTVSSLWTSALDRHEQRSDALAGGLQRTQAELAQAFAQQSASLLATVEQARADTQAELAASERQRMAALAQALEAMAASLQQAWQQAGAQNLAQQERICTTLEHTARGIQDQAQAQARDTLAEIARLMEAAAQAPRVAAELMSQLRGQLSDSLARDNTLLEDRARVMATLGTLLEAANQTATAQRGAIDDLVAGATALLQQAGERFARQVEAESGRLDAVAAQVTGGAAEVASLGEAFGFAVAQFSESSEALIVHLQRIEGALAKSSTRSDEQLAYYVAQAREIIDLSLASQKQIVDDLQQLSRPRSALAHEAA